MNSFLSLAAAGRMLSDTSSTCTDASWNAHYPASYREEAGYHFAPVLTVRAAAGWLAARGSGDFVDIGSGAGKFALIASMLHPASTWTGMELRESLVRESNRWKVGLSISNCNFLIADSCRADLSGYAGAFLFNPFGELIDGDDALGHLPVGSVSTYRASCAALNQRLSQVPLGFRLATYFCEGHEIPNTFRQHWSAEDGKLLGWVRE